jgi:hypothetical protein
MNLRFYNFYGFICFFPIWIFRANLEIKDILTLLLLFLFLPILAHNQIFKFCFKNKPKIIYFWLSLIGFYGLDQNLSLWNIAKNGNTIINLNSPYLNSLFFMIILIILFYLVFLFIKINAVKIIFSFIFVIFIFDIFNFNKNYSNFPKVNLIENKQTDQKNFNKKLVMIFDEMSGLNSIDSDVDSGKITDLKIKDYFIKNNFNIYINAFALFRDTDQSLGSALNFINSKDDYKNIDQDKEIHFLNKSNNYFTVNELNQNKFFNLNEHKNIIVNQSMYIDYCKHPKVVICNQFNPFSENLTFIKGFKNTKLSKYISAYRNNGSIFSYLFWRVILEARLVDTFLDPDGEKASIRYILNQIFENIKENKGTSLFFSHILVPHIPYGFNERCEYEGDKTINYNRITLAQKRIQHNLEKLCWVKYLDEFFLKLKKIDEFDDLEIIILSDHDSRIDTSNNIKNNVIFLHKEKNSEISTIKYKEISINSLLYNLSLN